MHVQSTLLWHDYIYKKRKTAVAEFSDGVWGTQSVCDGLWQERGTKIVKNSVTYVPTSMMDCPNRIPICHIYFKRWHDQHTMVYLWPLP